MPKPSPLAPSANTVVFGHARFQLMTDRLLRMEWSEDCAFEDRATLSVVNRAFPAVRHRASGKGKILTIETGALTLCYREDGKPFHAGNLSVRFDLDGRPTRWRAGQADRENLGGTMRTLDYVDGDRHKHWVDNPNFVEGAEGERGMRRLPAWEPVKLGPGFLSRAGWALHDDSTTIALEASGGRPWVCARAPGVRRDWYLLAYGLDFKAALRDAAQVFGAQPLPPRYAFGYWWCRYWAYTDRELEELVATFNRMSVPLDVLVVDMDWHREGWTGYTWDRRFFPDPRGFLRRMQREGLSVTLNLHPAEGVGRHEEAFPAMARAMGLDPAKADRVPFDCTDPRYMDAYFKLLHRPHEKLGVDFWWLDWQQGEQTRIPGLDPLPWLNQLHWEDLRDQPERAGKRPLIFSRFGGVGAGRYCIGFSGDTYSTWDSLRYQPRFTATSANVLYGYWSHDLGGHMPGVIEPELYLRWMQYGIHSPILRTHTSKNPDAERLFWRYPEPFASLMLESVRQRYEMAPYIYTECRKGTETGLSLCRPMYHEWPREKAAYAAGDQYLFGDHLIVAPVLTPADPKTELATAPVWLPPGTWFDCARGDVLKGGRTWTRRYLWSETPVFARVGTILPGQRDARRLKDPSIRDLVVTVYGGASGSYTLFEDDGLSVEKAGGAASIRLSHRRAGRLHRIQVDPVKKAYPGFAWRKSLEIRLPATLPPASVKVNGRALAWRETPGGDGWSYDGERATTVIRVKAIDLRRGATVAVAGASFGGGVAGLRGRLARLRRVMDYNRLATSYRTLHEDERLGVELAQLGNRVTRDPGTLAAELRGLPRKLARLERMLRELGERTEQAGMPPNPVRRERCERALALLADVQGRG